MVLVKISKERLDNLQFFEKVDTQPEDTDVPNRKDLVIGVEEKSTASLTVGAVSARWKAWSDLWNCARATLTCSMPRPSLAPARNCKCAPRLGRSCRIMKSAFWSPWLFGKRLQFGVDLFHRYNYYDSLNNQYSETFDGGTLSLTKSLGERLRGTVSYTAEQVHVSINSGFTTNSSTNYVQAANGLSQTQQVTGPNISTNIYDEHGSKFISKVGFSLLTIPGTTTNSRIAGRTRCSRLRPPRRRATPIFTRWR